MAKSGDIVVYRRDVCKVKGLAEKYRDNEDYYILAPLDDDTLTVYISVEKSKELFRPVMSREDAEALIAKIPSIDPVDVGDRMIETVYRELIHTDQHEDLVRIIKTCYLRNEAKVSKGQRRSEKDKMYFRMAEKMLYRELAASLDKTYDETADYIVGRLEAVDAQQA